MVSAFSLRKGWYSWKFLLDWQHKQQQRFRTHFISVISHFSQRVGDPLAIFKLCLLMFYDWGVVILYCTYLLLRQFPSSAVLIFALWRKIIVLFCHWPAYFKSDILKDKAIRNHLPVIEEKCTDCPIKVKYSTDDFSKARIKLQRLETDSQTESESETKRVPKKNIAYRDYDQFSEDSNDNIPTVPLPKKKTFTTLKNADVCMKKSIESRCGMPKNSQRFDDGTESLDEAITTSSKASCESVTIRSCNGCQENKALITETLRQLQVVKEDINYLIRLTKGNEIRVPIPKEFIQIKDFNELTQFNNSLDEHTSFTESCNKFQFVGGKDTPDTTRRILNRLMTNELAVITNWTGRNNKNGFKDMKNIIKLIHVSVRNNPLIQSATLDEVENLIKGWLRSASDREGGRARRFSKKL